MQPMDEMLLEWELTDKVRSGKTTLNRRIKMLEKIVIAEEASIGREMERLRDLIAELDQATIEVMGKGVFEEILRGTFDMSQWDIQHPMSNEAYGVEVELQSEKLRWSKVLEASNKVAMNRMEESEKVTTESSLTKLIHLTRSIGIESSAEQDPAVFASAPPR